MKVLGLMSGTSMDGLDCCLVKVKIEDDNLSYDIIDFKTFKFNQNIKNKIRFHLGIENLSKLKKIDDELGEYFSELAVKFLKDRKIDLVSLHGQTIFHNPRIKSIQVCNPKYFYYKFSVPVVYDFRSKDIKLGGEGAPLVPYLDWLLFKKMNKNVCLINIGGISNLTFIPSDSKRNNVLGFDAGPGMSLIDEFVKMKFNTDCDFNCKYSKNGFVNEPLLNYLMEESFITIKPPKSTGRDYFGLRFLKKVLSKFNKVSEYDFLRTLIAFTSMTIYKNIKLFLSYDKIDLFVVSGGGAHHSILIKDLKKNISNLFTSDKFNISVDCKEALLMAVLGFAAYNKIPNNMPSVTGAKKIGVYGRVFKG